MQLGAEQSNAQAEPAEEAAQEPAAEAAQGPAEEQAAADEAESSDKMAVVFLCTSDNQGFEAGCLGEEHICDSGTESQEEDYEELRVRKRNADEAESSDKMAVAFLCASDNQGFEAGCLGEEHICDSGTESQEEDYEELRARKRNANYNRLIALQDARKLREAGGPRCAGSSRGLELQL